MTLDTRGWAIFAWAVLGVCLFLLSPILRLAGVAVSEMQNGLTPVQMGAAVLWSVFMLYAEGWRGFHKKFSPRVVARSLALAESPSLVPVVLAPFTAMGLFHATKKRMIVSWSLLVGITVLVLAVRQLPMAWRGVVDTGVVVGLSAGLLSILWFTAQTLAGRPPRVPTDMPTPKPSR